MNGVASSGMTTSASGLQEIRKGVCEKVAMASVLAIASSVVFFQVKRS